MLDIPQFLRGHVAIDLLPQCMLLCPIRGESLPLDPADVALAMELPTTWLSAEEVHAYPAEKRARLLDLHTPGGFERFFIRGGAPAPELVPPVAMSDGAPAGIGDLMGEFGVTMVGPPIGH